MIVDFGDFDEGAVAGGATGEEAGALELFAVVGVELPTMTVTLEGEFRLVELVGVGFRM